MNRRQLFVSLASPWLAAPAAGADIVLAWDAKWVFPAENGSSVSPAQSGAFLFRRTFQLAAAKPAEPFTIHVSADNRYILFVNGKQVSRGPARGDLNHWRYETVDLAPFLRTGDNVLAAIVWNEGIHAALAQITHRTAFLVKAEDFKNSALVNTGGASWKVTRNAAYQFEPIPPAVRQTGYFAIGPTERVDASLYPWGWESTAFDDSKWEPPAVGPQAALRDTVDGVPQWLLVPRPIPPMEEAASRFRAIRRYEGIDHIPSGFPAQAGVSLAIPASTRARLILDQGELTTAYPVLQVRSGSGARITMRYAESLYHPGPSTGRGGFRKGNRDEVANKMFIGFGDTFVADGQDRTYQPLHWRTWRFVELDVQTGAQPLEISGIHSIYTGYPFRRTAAFDSGDPLHTKILDTGWRTARLCAHETYMDCPYYEQLQYAGDTRIQCLVSLFMSGDSRLMRNAIEQIDSSRTAEGATGSRAPSAKQQYIPTFSLFWIGMLRDYWWYVDDPEFVRSNLTGVRAVLGFYSRYLTAQGFLRPMPWWNYVDWIPSWQYGMAPSEKDIMPGTVHALFKMALDWGADMEDALGSRVRAAECRETSAKVGAFLKQTFFDPARGLFTEDRAHKHPTQHVNSMAVLAGLPVTPAAAQQILKQVDADTTITRCSVYFRYYWNEALRSAGLGNWYIDRLDTWKQMLDMGLTTWAESDNQESRSDCHAWGSSPNIEFFRTVAGIDSASPGFKRVVIRPHLGSLKHLSVTVPHPRGVIKAVLERVGADLKADVSLPKGVSGNLIWQGRLLRKL